MQTRRIFSALMLGASAATLSGLAAPASAQRVDRIIAFGDSYADEGNAFQLAGVSPPIIYSTGRFSGGTNYVDTLGQILDVPIYNYAIGGARTGNGNQNAGLPGFSFEVQSFLTSSGGANGAFPTIPGTFDENDLVTVSIGGNDARAYQQGGGTVAGAPAAAATALTAATANLDLLVAAGAPTISFLAGDTGLLPEVGFTANPALTASVRTAYSTAFNTGIQATLAGYAADGVMVHYLDLTRVLQQVQADYAAYGLTGLACPAFPPPAGPGVPGSTACVDAATANQFLFYGDQLHLTSAGFAIVGRYVAAQLQAPLTLQGPSELGVDTARQFGRTLTSRIELSPPRDGDLAEGTQLFLVGDTFSRDNEQTASTDAFDTDGVGVTAGATFGLGNAMVGVAGNYSRPKLRFAGDSASARTTSWQVGAFAGFGFFGGFAQGYVGYGKDDHHIRRAGVVDNLSADADGSHWLAGAKAGYLVPLGVMRAGPVVALDYAKAKVDGYTEEGNAALALNVDSVSAKSLTGSIGVELRGDFLDSGIQLRPFVSAVMEKELSGDDHVVHFSQTASPTIVNSWTLGERPDSAYARLSGGASAAIMNAVTLDAAVSSTIARDEGNELSAQIGVRMGF